MWPSVAVTSSPVLQPRHHGELRPELRGAVTRPSVLQPAQRRAFEWRNGARGAAMTSSSAARGAAMSFEWQDLPQVRYDSELQTKARGAAARETRCCEREGRRGPQWRCCPSLGAAACGCRSWIAARAGRRSCEPGQRSCLFSSLPARGARATASRARQTGTNERRGRRLQFGEAREAKGRRALDPTVVL